MQAKAKRGYGSRRVLGNRLRRLPAAGAFLLQRPGGTIEGAAIAPTNSVTYSLESGSLKLELGRPPEHTVTAVFRDWIAERRTPAVWVGRIRGDFSRRLRGNLILEEGAGRFSSANLRLQGGYVWSVLAANGETVVVIDTAQRELDFRLLVADFCALQFTFGRRMQLEWLTSLDETGSLDEHLDGAYLKLHVALEALCQEVPRPKSRLLVNDSREWLAWVDRNASELGSFAHTSKSAVKLVNEVKAAQRSPATGFGR